LSGGKIPSMPLSELEALKTKLQLTVGSDAEGLRAIRLPQDTKALASWVPNGGHCGLEMVPARLENGLELLQDCIQQIDLTIRRAGQKAA